MDRPAMEVFADNLRRLRAVSGMTQVELAVAAGVNRTTLADYERGAAKNVELRTIEVLARALNCVPQDLVRELPAGFVVLGDLLDEYLERYGKADARSAEFAAWTRTLPAVFWFGGEVNADSLHDLYLHYVKRHPTPEVVG